MEAELSKKEIKTRFLVCSRFVMMVPKDRKQVDVGLGKPPHGHLLSVFETCVSCL